MQNSIPRFQDDFPALARGFDFDDLERDPHSIFALGSDLTFNYFNPGWFRFARDNAGDAVATERFGLGSPFAAVLPPVVRSFYINAYRRVMETGEIWRHDYECSAPDRYRLFHQIVFPLHERRGILAVNSLREEHVPVSDLRDSCEPVRGVYRSEATGLMTQCCNCRRMQRPAMPDLWDWVPAWVANMPPNTTAGLCAICHAYYWRSRRG